MSPTAHRNNSSSRMSRPPARLRLTPAINTPPCRRISERHLAARVRTPTHLPVTSTRTRGAPFHRGNRDKTPVKTDNSRFQASRGFVDFGGDKRPLTGAPATCTGAMGRSGMSLGYGFRFLLLAVTTVACVPHMAASSYGQTVGLASRSALARSDDFHLDAASTSSSDDDAAISAARSLLKMTKKNTKARPDFSEGIYRTKGDVFDEVKAIVAAHPDTMRIDTVQSTRGGYSSELVIVTVELGGLSDDDGLDGEAQNGHGVGNSMGGQGTSSTNQMPNTAIEKTRILYNFGEHGRELITVEVAVDLLHAFAKGAEHAAELAHPDASDSTQQIRKALLHTTFKIVPMENVNGRDKVERGDYCERKNGRGVDCNRNWAVDWGVKAPDYDPNEEYPGTAPFSEPEAFMMKGLLEQFQPHVWVNVHSGMEALFMPFDHKASEPSGEGADAMKNILQKINRQSCGSRCVVGGGGKGVGYLAHGTATDYVYVMQKTPVTYTWEIYGDTKAHYLDCFRMFNPVERTEKNKVVQDWVQAAISLVPMVREHPDVPMRYALVNEGGALGDGLGITSRDAKRDFGEGFESDHRVGNSGGAGTSLGRLRGGSDEGVGSVSGGVYGGGLGLRRSDDVHASLALSKPAAVEHGFESWFGTHGDRVDRGFSTTTDQTGMTLPIIVGIFIGVVIVFRCVVVPRMRRARFLVQIQKKQSRGQRISP